MPNVIRGLITIAGLGVCLACSGHFEAGTIRSDSMTSAGGGYRTTSFGQLSDTIVHLSGGDSVELQSAGPVHVPKDPEGLMITYHPYFDLADTERVKQTALAVFDALRPKFTRNPQWVVLRSASRTAAERNRDRRGDQFYGVVLEKHEDSHWYPQNGQTAVR